MQPEQLSWVDATNQQAEWQRQQLAAEAAKEDAIAAAEAHADAEWKEAAYVAVWRVAGQVEHFTTDHVWRLLAQEPFATHEPRALGAVMRLAAKDGMVRATGAYWPSSRARCHGRPVRVWESRIYSREERTA